MRQQGGGSHDATVDRLARAVNDLPADAEAAWIVDRVLADLQAADLLQKLEQLNISGQDFRDAIEAIRQRFV